MTAENTAWTTADERASAAEGWAIFDSFGSAAGPVQIQSFDCPQDGEPDITDEQAWVLIFTAAARGSDRHRRALAIVRHYNPREWWAIQRWAVLGPDAPRPDWPDYPYPEWH